VKVLLLNNSLANGGLERQLVLLARHLPGSCERRLWCLDSGPHADAVVSAGVPLRVRPRRGRWDVTPALDLWRVIDAWRPDVVHAWHWMPAAAAVPACLALRIPLIDGSIRMGSVPREFGRPRRGIMRFAALVVANSQAGLEAWRVDPDRGRVIHNAFDDARLAASAPVVPRDASAERPFTVVMAARMAPPKDFRTVLRAARLLTAKSQRGEWRFILVGSGVDRSVLREEAAELVQAGVVVFPEPGIEVIQHLRAAHVGLLATDPAILAEGCSNAIMEYMACGLPVVATESGGNRELVRDGVTGFVVPPRDAHALASGLAALRADRGLCAAFGAAGQERVATEFTVERMVAEYVDAYADVARRRRR
jgi:glycosyltransferase involved in cell wall biosynthesis